MSSRDRSASPPPRGSASLRPLANLLVKAGSAVEVEIEGASMEPAVPEGSTVRVRCGGTDSVAPPQVIAFLAGGRRMTIHRVVARRGPYLLTRGDANLLCDPPLGLGDVLGRVEGRLVRSEWREIPERRTPVRLRGAISALNTRLMTFALGRHIRAAQALALLQLALIAPVALFRHRGSSRGPWVLSMFRLAAQDDVGRAGTGADSR